MADRSATFGLLALSVAGAVAVPIVLGSLYTAWRASVTASLPPEDRVVAPPSAAAPSAAPPVAEPAPPAEDEVPPWPREVDRVVFGRLETVPAGSEARDVAPEAPYRVDLTRDAGQALVNAAKVDLDRDGSWDERWTLAPHAVVRESSPADDGRYTERYRWEGGAWVQVEPPGGG